MKRRALVPATMAAALSLGLFGLAACTGGKSKRFIPPPPISVAKITTAPLGSDYAGVAIDPASSRTTLGRVPVLGGIASLTGVVTGPDGPVVGATIRIERLVGDASGHLDLVAAGDGTWRAPQPVGTPSASTVASFPDSTFPGQLTTSTLAPTTSVTSPPVGPQGLLGGRYRVRAWRTPDLALTTPQVLFLDGTQSKQLTIQLSRYAGTAVTSTNSPDPPVLNGSVNVTAAVTTASVDSEGVVRYVPSPGASVALNVGSGWTLTSGPTATNGQGKATFQLRCQALGVSPVELVVNASELFTLPVRGCVAPASTTTTTIPFDPNSTSTTFSPPGPGSTSSTGSPPRT